MNELNMLSDTSQTDRRPNVNPLQSLPMPANTMPSPRQVAHRLSHTHSILAYRTHSQRREHVTPEWWRMAAWVIASRQHNLDLDVEFTLERDVK